MSYTELNLDLTEEHRLLKNEVHKFAVEVLRPASIELDRMSPEDVITRPAGRTHLLGGVGIWKRGVRCFSRVQLLLFVLCNPAL